MPNVTGLEPGEKTDIWYYHGAPAGGVGEWRIAGTATVSADGRSVASDPGVGIPNFCGTCGLFGTWCPNLPGGDSASPESACNKAGNPVELYSGYEMPNFGGLKCGGLTPMEVGLSYHPVDAFQGRSGLQGSMGEGWVLDHDIVLADGALRPDTKRLLLPPNSRIDFTRQPDDSFTAESDPRFRGAVLRMTSASPRAWELAFKDGARWRFGDCNLSSAACFLLEKIDPSGNLTAITRRAGHRIATMKDAEGGITRFTYVGDNEYPANALCPQGTDGLRLKTIHYPGKANPTENFHGASRRVLRQVGPDGRELRFEYRLTGACVTHISQPGQRCQGPQCPIVDSWDNHQAGWRIHGGQVTATTVVDAEGRRTTRRYNAAGLALEDTDTAGQTTRLERDGQNRVTESTDPLGGVSTIAFDAAHRPLGLSNPRNHTIATWGYDDADRLVSRADAHHQTQTRSYDATGRLASHTDRDGRVTTYAHDGAGRLIRKTLANGIRQHYTWDAASRLTRIEYLKDDDSLIERIDYAYDANGRRIAKTRLDGSSVPETPFTAEYDAADRLTRITLTASNETYDLAHDAHGNLTRKTRSDGTETTTYTWDASHRLIRLDRTGARPLTAEFQYDVLNRRIRRIITRGNTTHTTRYLHAGAQAIAEIHNEKITTLLTGLMLDEALARYTDGEQRTQLTDALGSVIALAQEDQSTATGYRYSPYGETTPSGEASDNASQYTAREHDGTGLYYYRARYYDPVLKRFISEDPIGVAGGVNPYVYVENDPLNQIDPLGRLYAVSSGSRLHTPVLVLLRRWRDQPPCRLVAPAWGQLRQAGQ